MRSYFTKSFVLIFGSVAVVGCSGIQPSHYGKFSFEGRVLDESGKPVRKAWVKVRGWETQTNDEGRWSQEHVLHCGALRDSPGAAEEGDAVLVTASGYASSEEPFVVKHPAWFTSCKPEQRLIFETVLKRGPSLKSSGGTSPNTTSPTPELPTLKSSETVL